MQACRLVPPPPAPTSPGCPGAGQAAVPPAEPGLPPAPAAHAVQRRAAVLPDEGGAAGAAGHHGGAHHTQVPQGCRGVRVCVWGRMGGEGGANVTQLRCRTSVGSTAAPSRIPIQCSTATRVRPVCTVQHLQGYPFSAVQPQEYVLSLLYSTFRGYPVSTVQQLADACHRVQRGSLSARHRSAPACAGV